MNSTTITAVTGARAAGTVNVVVTNSSSLSGALTNGFTYAVPPTLSSIAPATGTTAGGTWVTLAGSNFLSGAIVRFAGVLATNVLVVSATTISATTPAHGPGSVYASVTNPDTQASALLNGFTYQVRAGSPFTDATLDAGVTLIKAAHVVELRDRINEQLVRFGQPTHQFANSIVTGASMQVNDLTELYTAVNKALQAAGRPTIAVPSLTAGVTTVMRSHINALRSAVVTLEGL